jgi:hypothetical protein
MNKTKIQTQVFFMARPGTTANDPRSYLVKRPGEPYASVRVSILNGDPNQRKYSCDCKPADGERCRHLNAAIEIDSKKFSI